MRDFNINTLNEEDKDLIINLVKEAQENSSKYLVEEVLKNNECFLLVLKSTNLEYYEKISKEFIENYIKHLNLFFKLTGEKPKSKNLTIHNAIVDYFEIEPSRFVWNNKEDI